MKKNEIKINIVGAGVAGLVAAQLLETNGYSPQIFEASDRPGGRLKTDLIEKYQLDHGFQVMLDAYPMARKYLDYKALELQAFLPGALIFKNGSSKFGDPLRNQTFLFPTLFSKHASLSDKLKVYQLNMVLKKKSLSEIFESEEITTLEYLESKGFSPKVISDFFKPFFSGIFLETELQTSSRMFEFVYKMFSEGMATLPKGGIEEIPKQLAKNLKKTTFHFKTKIDRIENSQLVIDGLEPISSDFILVATEADQLIPNLRNQRTAWKSCECLYFECAERIEKKAIIGLIADKRSLINNIFYHNSLETRSKGDADLLSVTVIKEHGMDESSLAAEVEKQLEQFCGIKTKRFLKRYEIKKALPDLNSLQNDIPYTETQLTENLFLAGDQLLNASLNAAMRSGERAAEGIISSIEGRSSISNFTSEYQ